MTDINKILEPYYNQFEKLFTLREAYGIDMKFFKKALKGFMRQYLYEQKYIHKLRRKIAYKRYKEELDEFLAKAEETVIQAVEVVKQAIEEEEPQAKKQEQSKELALTEEKEPATVQEESPQDEEKEESAAVESNEADEVEDLTDS